VLVKRVSALELLTLAEAMPERERHIVETVGELRLVSGNHVERLFFDGEGTAASRGRSTRRVLAALSDQQVLTRLERRIGGVRAGSAGAVYGLGPVGKRLLAYWRGEGLKRVRAAYEPRSLFVRHTLAVAEQYARLVEAARDDRCDLLAFDSEPTCWRTYASGRGGLVTLKPDALVRLGLGDFEQRSFVEVDCGSEGRGALLRKCRYYVAYYQSGREQVETGVFPAVVWITTTQARVRLLVDVCSTLPPEYWRLFCVGTPERLLALCSGEGSPAQEAA
jgi:hypothetical protein